MKLSDRNDYLTRDNILKLLSDDEVSKVSTAETAAALEDGDAFIDLEQLERGVQHAQGKALVMGRVLPRKAVHENTWSRILSELATLRNQTASTHKL
jgi:hypothetical protein